MPGFNSVAKFSVAKPGGAASLQPGLYENTNTFYSPTVTYVNVLTPALYADADTFYAPTASPGAVTVTPSLYADGDTFYAPTVAPGTYTLTPSLYADADTLYAPTTGVGLRPAFYANTNTFYASSIAATATLSPALFSDGDTFFAPTVAAGAVTLTPALFADDDTFYAPTVAPEAYALTPSLYSDADTIYAARIDRPVYPALYSDADAFYAPTVTAGTVTLSPSLFANTNTHYSATVFKSTFISPDSDITDGNWVNEVGSNVNLYASIDESPYNDTDFIRSGNEPTNDICEVGLGNPGESLGQPFIVCYRYKKVDSSGSGSMQLIVSLNEGAYTIASWTHNDIAEDYVIAQQQLSTAEYNAISNQNDLSLEFEATAS